MKQAYPIIIYKKDLGEDMHIVFIPDFEVTTQGKDLVECIEMARDLIGLTWIDLKEDKEDIPEPYSKENKYAFNDESLEIEIETLVDIDFEKYRKKLMNKAVKKTLTIPYKLNEAAEEKGINFSQLLQKAIEEELKMNA